MMEASVLSVSWSSVLIVVALLMSSTHSSAADLRGDEFITTMDGTAIAGAGADGTPFNLYFLAGGRVTYSAVARDSVSGTWRLNRDGSLCVNWAEPVDTFEGCWHVSFNGDTVEWQHGAKSGHGRLVRGSVVKYRAEDDQ